MTRITGTADTPLIEYVNDVWKVRWGGQKQEDGGVLYNEVSFPFKPSVDNIKDIILSIENLGIDNKILSGYVWKGMSVWLSSENQFNYKAAYDLAVQTNCSNLPVTFKFGDTDNPKYYTFDSLSDLSDFYAGAMTFVNQTLSEGWTNKDSIDWSKYE